MRHHRALFLLVGLLLLQFFLRSHEILALPGYADESLHIRRAEIVWDFNSVWSWLPKKLLLYYYLGLFETARSDYLLLSRLVVGLFTLLGGAALYSIGRRLFDAGVGAASLLLYALAPFTVFFDRLALADPFTLALMLLTVWAMLHWLAKPSPRWGLALGLLLTLALLAKLTAAGLLALPPLLLWLWRRDAWRRYLHSGAVMAGVFALVWLPLGAVILYRQAVGTEVIVIDDYLLNINEPEQNFAVNLLDNLRISAISTGRFMGFWMLPLSLLAALGLLRYRWRVGLLLLALWGLAWLPALAFGSLPRSRYLEPGIPFMLLLLVGGGALLLRRFVHRRAVRRGLLLGALGLYSLGWALPFFVQAVRVPHELPLPDLDRWRYVQSTTAAYGQIEALAYLRAEGDLNPASGRVQVYALLGSCHLLRLYMDDPDLIDLTCLNFDYVSLALDAEQLADLQADLAQQGSLYVLVEDRRDDLSAIDAAWAQVAVFPRPHGGIPIELWRLSPQPSTP